MSEQLAFIQACLDRSQPITAICDQFGISEKTGHKWLKRFRTEGALAFTARSHAPHHVPHRMAATIAAAVLAARDKHPLYGAAKLRDWLVQQHPDTPWPAASSIGALLVREGRIKRRRRRVVPGRGRLTSERLGAGAPNDVWTADFKGHFRLGAGPYCYPLTVLDLHTHFLLGCVALPSVAVADTRAHFIRLFREFGLPRVVRTDNGVPFAQPNALGRLGILALWWVRLGIQPEHTTPATPSENGAHERFHRTLAAATAHPPAESFRAQQRRFDHFRQEYNTERPHESLLAHVPPARLYTPAAPERAYPTRLPALCYPTDATIRRVSHSGCIKWQQHRIFLSSNLAGDDVCLTAIGSELLRVTYATLKLGDLDPLLGRFRPDVRWLG